MDPVTCLGVASAVVQFVDFTFEILSGAQQLYEDGQLKVHEQTSKVVKDFSNLGKEMGLSLRSAKAARSLTKNEAELETICKDCSKLADEMATKLKKFQLTDKRNVWKSVGAVVKSIWSKKELDVMEKKLSQYRDMMDSRLLGSLSERVEQVLIYQYGQTKAINEHTREIVASALLDVHASLTRDLQEQTKILNSLIDRSMNSKGDKAALETDTDVRNQKVLQGDGLKEDTRTDKDIYDDIQQQEARLHQWVTQAVIDSLRFDTITERYEGIAEAHKHTFDWIFQPMENNEDPNEDGWSDYVQWLRKGEGLYWIHGKPGSGKSTLMKFIYENPKTYEHLLIWANGTPYYLAPFFFWSGGTKLQKSQDGLLRSLLLDVLQRIPELVPYVLPFIYATRYAALNKIGVYQEANTLTSTTLVKAFRLLISQTQIPIKLFLLIDGLDEFDGLESDIAKLFKGVVLSPHVKVCVSSRTHVPFEDAFAGRPQLRLQDLTRQDINKYIDDRLVRDEMMEALAATQPTECHALVTEIGDAAEGVFLWVTLAVSSLLNGLSKHDQVGDLQLRLRELPKDLTKLYEQMVLKVDGIYQEEASRLYQLVAEATEKPGDWKPVELLSLRMLSIAMKRNLDLVQEMEQEPPNLETIVQQAKRMDILLKTRCGGLLEVQYGRLKSTALSPDMKVTYLHRTAREFLEAWETRQVLLGRTRGPDKPTFQPAVAIFKSIVLVSREHTRDGKDGVGWKGQYWTYARRIDFNKQVPIPELINLLETYSHVLPGNSLLPSAVECGLGRYLETKLKDPSVNQEEGPRPLIDHAIVPTYDSAAFVSPDIVKLLLKYGADPNKSFRNSSPWQNCLSYLALSTKSPSSITDNGLLSKWADILEILLEHGADPKTSFSGPHKIVARGKMKRNVDTGDEWTISEMLDSLYANSPIRRDRIKQILKKAIQDKKSGSRVLQQHTPISSNRDLTLSTESEKPQQSNETHQARTEDVGRASKFCSCCNQQ